MTLLLTEFAPCRLIISCIQIVSSVMPEQSTLQAVAQPFEEQIPTLLPNCPAMSKQLFRVFSYFLILLLHAYDS
jgi:hypothetical protein